ncbi:MAG: uL22 family ribosomal protein [Candidatus Aenigmatarchaeota archaeon]
MNEARAVAKGLRISTKKSLVIANQIRNKPLAKAKRLLNDLISKKISLEGKYYTNTAENFLSVLKSAEANAQQKNLNIEKLFVKQAKVDKGYKFIRPKSRAKFAGRKAKVTHVTIVLEER